MSEPLAGVRDAYDASATAWAAGPAGAYDVLADVVVSAAVPALSSSRVLDLGAGTGPAARAARRAGAARVIGIDLSSQMLRAGSGWDAVVIGDARRLPFRGKVFSHVVAACCLGHLPDPVGALVECRRVAGAIVASAFLSGWTHPAKAEVDAVAARFGFATPSWYGRLKADVEPVVDDPDSLAAMARTAGYSRVSVTTTPVDVGVRTPEELATWRLGMAHLAPFVASLDPQARADLRAQAAAALVGCPSLVVPLVVLSAGPS